MPDKDGRYPAEIIIDRHYLSKKKVRDAIGRLKAEWHGELLEGYPAGCIHTLNRLEEELGLVTQE